MYQTVYEKAAALAQSIIINHPFVDGNKRTGFLGLLAVLDGENVALTASNELIYAFVIDISTGSKSFEEIVEWLKAKLKGR